jgi:two-component system KDP operon response regulator KdpE
MKFREFFLGTRIGESMRKKKNTILIVDSDPQTYKILDKILDKRDFEVVKCSSGRQAMGLCASIKPNIVLLELDMPDMEGKEIIFALRELSQIPILILSNHYTDEDVICTLNMGADDYIFKPFNAYVLQARINSALRKYAVRENGKPELSNGPLRMDMIRHEVFMNDHLIAFTPKEYSLLRYFITHCGKMLYHREILKEVWGSAHSDDTQYLRVFIGQLREKIEENPAVPLIITTEQGIGYRMEFLQGAVPFTQREIRV